MHVRPKIHDFLGTLLTSAISLHQEIDWGKVIKKFSALNFPRGTVNSIIVKLEEAWNHQDSEMKLRTWAEVIKNPMSTLKQLQKSSTEMEVPAGRTTISEILDQSGLYARVARWKSLQSKKHVAVT